MCVLLEEEFVLFEVDSDVDREATSYGEDSGDEDSLADDDYEVRVSKRDEGRVGQHEEHVHVVETR